MLGLPVGEYRGGYENNREEEHIVDFIRALGQRTHMRFNVNVGTFVPKPHTPYQWVPQIDEETAWRKLHRIRDTLKPLGHKVSVHDPFTAIIEGLISRGDGRVGELLVSAYRAGCRLDAWNEHLRIDIWRSILEANAPLAAEILGGRDPGQRCPWDFIDSGVFLAYLSHEREKSDKQEFTSPCTDKCTHKCNMCSDDTIIVSNNIQNHILDCDMTGKSNGDEYSTSACMNNNIGELPDPADSPAAHKPDPPTWRILFAFEKRNTAAFLSHLSVIEVFSMAFIRAGIPAQYSLGFNPLPRLDFAAPLSVGVSSGGEIATLDTEGFYDAAQLPEALNQYLPEGFRVTKAINVTIPSGAKKHSVASLLWGFAYDNGTPADGNASNESREDAAYVKAADEKNWRRAWLSGRPSVWGLSRTAILAKDANGAPDSYFTVYRSLYVG
jgi:radical SAM-linked protein